LLKFLNQQQLLPENWQQVIRCGLFCCPTLVMPLIAGTSHNQVSSVLGWSIAVMLGSGNETQDDLFSGWLNSLFP